MNTLRCSGQVFLYISFFLVRNFQILQYHICLPRNTGKSSHFSHHRILDGGTDRSKTQLTVPHLPSSRRRTITDTVRLFTVYRRRAGLAGRARGLLSVTASSSKRLHRRTLPEKFDSVVNSVFLFRLRTSVHSFDSDCFRVLPRSLYDNPSFLVRPTRCLDRIVCLC